MINHDDYISELRHCLERDDIIKFRVLVQCMSSVEASSVRRFLYHLSMSSSALVIPAYLTILASRALQEKDELMLKQGLESKLILSGELKTAYTRLANDEEKSLLVESVLNCDQAKAVSILKSLLSSFDSPDDILFVLERSQEVFGASESKFIEEFMYSGNAELEAVSLQILSRTDSDESANILSKRLGACLTIDRQIIEILGRMKAKSAVKKLVSLLGSSSAENRNLARQIIAKNGDIYSEELSTQIESVTHEDYLILLINAAGESSSNSCIKSIRKVLHNGFSANVRFAAYEALGMLPVKAGAYTLADGLLDEVEEVRFAAARAVNYNWNPMLAEGIANFLRLEERANEVVDVLFNAEAEKAISSLLDNADFKEHGVALLNAGLANSLQEKYMRFLKHHKRHDWLALIKEQSDTKTNYKVCAVDDSRMILSVYRKYLSSMGLDVVTFESGESALEYLTDNKVDVLFTDLNMPGMTGVELTQSVRKLYDAKQLPIIMVTTQNDSFDRKRSLEVGVNFYLNKPFDKDAVVEILRTELKMSV